MADLVAISDGNLTASIWGLVDTTSKLISTNASSHTGLTTSGQDSTAFTPGAITVKGVAVRLGQRGAGSPTNTMTITLRNSTAGTDVASVTVNVSDLPECGMTEVDGGWVYVQFASTHLLLAATNYVVRALLSSTSTAVSIRTDGTNANWQRMLITTTTQAPAAGDDMHITATFDGTNNPATKTARSVTMDSTSATDYGSASTNSEQPAMTISTGGTLVFSIAANTILQLSGWLIIYRGGTYTMGAGASPVPTGTTATLQFDCAADGDFGFMNRNGTRTTKGEPRTSGKAVVATLLTADVAAGGGSPQTWNVAHDTGWLSGDEVGIAPTARTYSQFEARTLNADAGASSIQVTAALTNAHLGTSPTQAEIILLTRNVTIRSVSTTAMAFVSNTSAAVDSFEWTLFRYVGAVAVPKYGLDVSVTTGSVTVNFCAFRDTESAAIGFRNDSGNVTITDTVCYNCATTEGWGVVFGSGNIGGPWTFTRLIVIGTAANSSGFWFPGTTHFLSVIDCTFTGCQNVGCRIHQNGATFAAFSGNTCHSNGNGGFSFTQLRATTVGPPVLENLKAWRNGGIGVDVDGIPAIGAVFDDILSFGNTDSNYRFWNGASFCRFKNVRAYGDASFGSVQGMILGGHGGVYVGAHQCVFDTCTFGGTDGIFRSHSTRDIYVVGAVSIIFRNTSLNSTQEIYYPDATHGSVFHWQRKDGTAALHSTEVTMLGGATPARIAYETTTVDVSPSLKMTPVTSLTKLESGAGVPGRGFMIRVLNTEQPTISVKVRKDGTYNGNAPRLILKGNGALGIGTDDVVLDTLSVGADTWETLSGQIPVPVTDDGAVEVVVDCDGTAGNVFVDTLTVS